jgi:hypothetical protein
MNAMSMASRIGRNRMTVPPTAANGAADETPGSNGTADRREQELQQIRDALRGLRFGSINVVVQDGVVVQIDRTEKRRLRQGTPNSA